MDKERIGKCFQWAYREIVRNNKLTLVHAVVHHPWGNEKYFHAWIEDKKLVKDWQTMSIGMSKYARKGWPLKIFYDAFTPGNVNKYTHDQALENAARTEHYGPWEDN